MAEATTPEVSEYDRWSLSSRPGWSLRVDPERMQAAAAEYDGMADRLQGALDKQLHTAKFGSAGRDEVSTAVSRAFEQTNEHFEAAAKKGIEQLRLIAEAFRRNAQGFVDVDYSSASHFKRLGA